MPKKALTQVKGQQKLLFAEYKKSDHKKRKDDSQLQQDPEKKQKKTRLSTAAAEEQHAHAENSNPQTSKWTFRARMPSAPAQEEEHACQQYQHSPAKPAEKKRRGRHARRDQVRNSNFERSSVTALHATHTHALSPSHNVLSVLIAGSTATSAGQHGAERRGVRGAWHLV